MDTPKYQVGQKVRVVKDEYCTYPKGTVLTVRYVHEGWVGAGSEGKDVFYFENDWIEPQTSLNDYIKAIGKTVPELGQKFDSDKPKWSLMPRGVLSQVIQVMTYGAKKYSPDNWMHVDPDRYYDALNRHVDAWRNGERLDAETGKHHLAHALCCLIFMLWHDDNPKKASE